MNNLIFGSYDKSIIVLFEKYSNRHNNVARLEYVLSVRKYMYIYTHCVECIGLFHQGPIYLYVTHAAYNTYVTSSPIGWKLTQS